MEPLNRKPQYHEKSGQFRIISAANGLWLAQHYIPIPEGVAVKIRDPKTGRERPQLNPWHSWRPAEDYASALARINRAAAQAGIR